MYFYFDILQCLSFLFPNFSYQCFDFKFLYSQLIFIQSMFSIQMVFLNFQSSTCISFNVFILCLITSFLNILILLRNIHFIFQLFPQHF